MRKTLTVLLEKWFICAVFLVGCGESPGHSAATAQTASTSGDAAQQDELTSSPANAMHDQSQLVGEWTTPFGIMKIIQNGNKLRGTFPLYDGFTIEGALPDNGRRFEFIQNFHGDTGALGMVLSSDGNSFEAQARIQGIEELVKWSGKRVADAPNPTVAAQTPAPVAVPGKDQPKIEVDEITGVQLASWTHDFEQDASLPYISQMRLLVQSQPDSPPEMLYIQIDVIANNIFFGTQDVFGVRRAPRPEWRIAAR